MLSWLWICIWGCTSSPKQPPQTDTGEDSNAVELTPPTETDAGWTLGTVQACDNPSVVPTYTDVSANFGYNETTYPVYNIEGAIALQEYNDEWWIWQIGTNEPYGWNQNGEMVEVDAASVAVRLYILDVNEDGEDDLVIIGEFLEIVWSVLTPHQTQELLLDFEPSRGVRDVGLMDIDGDGDQDLWALIGTGGLDYHEGWGLIFEKKEDGTFELPYEYLDREIFGATFDATVIDWEGDGDPDLYVCNDFGFLWGGNHLLINDNGALTPGDSEGADIVTACMGSSFADMDMDGNMDIYATATAGQHFLKGTDNGFIEYADSYELPIAFNEQMLWGAQVTDYNNDGLFDLLVATSGFTRVSQNGPNADPYPIWLIEQQPDHTYTEISENIGLEQNSVSRAVITHDINNDGVVDFLVSDAKRLAYVYMSDECTANNWIEISGPDNSIVRVVAGDKVWTIHMTHTPGMAASMPSTVHIGLGEIDTIDWIDIDIPWLGTRSILGPIDARQHIQFKEP